MLLYSLLFLTGYDLGLEDLQQFRQWKSRAPGHPERGVTPGVEVTTGPLGQGVGNSVGLAIAERWLATTFNRPGNDVVDHYTYVLASDGDLMEGVAAEAASLAGTLRLGRLIVLYDANLPEIRSIVTAADGSIYAAALGGSLVARGAGAATPASVVQSTVTFTAPPTTITVTDDSAQGGLDVKPKADAAKQSAAQPVQTQAPASPLLDVSGVEKSAVYRINTDNTVETLWTSKDENVYDVLPVGDYLVLATDGQGRIYRLSQDRKATLLVETNQGEATRLAHDGVSVIAATGNLGKLYRLGDGWAADGNYESPVHDAGAVARWGRLSWRARATVSSFSGASRVMTEPAPMVAPAPMLTGATRALLEPMKAPSPMCVVDLFTPS